MAILFALSWHIRARHDRSASSDRHSLVNSSFQINLIYINLDCYSIDELDKFDDAYVGRFDSEADFARHIVDECYTLEGLLADYFDYDAFADDLFMCDYYFDNGHVIRR